MEIGLLCGTFNPIHEGHCLIANCALHNFNLDKVLFITSPNPPHRDDELLDPQARHEMVQAACTRDPKYEACDIELKREGPSYTIDTLEELERIYPKGTKFSLILGEDNLLQLDKWKRAKDLVKKCRILVAQRTGGAPQLVQGNTELIERIEEEAKDMAKKLPGLKVALMDFPGLHISSTQIREDIKLGLPLKPIVPKEVIKIITERGYYQ